MKRLLIASTAIVTLASGISYGLTRPAGVTADEVPPIVAQVENHEVRITDLEAKTDDTQTQVNQNTADITVIQDKTGVAPAPKVQAVQTPVAQPTTQTVPQPEPQVDPWTVMDIIEMRVQNKTYPDKTDLHCKFMFSGGQIGWSISTISEKYTQSPRTCASNFYTSVGQVMHETQRRNLRFDPAPF